jgi:carbon-monoxide dehydrogenase large subunit
VIDALAEFGVSQIDMPLTPEKIWRAIHTEELNNAPREHQA